MRSVLFLLLFFFSWHTEAATLPPMKMASSTSIILPASQKPIKPTFLQKLQIKMLKKVMLKRSRLDGPTMHQEKQATASMILGIASLLLLFVPSIAVIAIPAAIVGFILGIKSLRGNSNTKGIVGLVTSSLTLLLLLIAIILVAALLSGFE